VQENKSEIVKRRGVKEEKKKIKGLIEDYKGKGEGGEGEKNEEQRLSNVLEKKGRKETTG
jgi:hypothetical protein